MVQCQCWAVPVDPQRAVTQKQPPSFSTSSWHPEEGEKKHRPKMSPEKAMGDFPCQTVVTCRCWRITDNKAILMFKWLLTLTELILKFMKCCWMSPQCLSTTQFLCMCTVPVGIFTHSPSEKVIHLFWTFSQHIPSTLESSLFPFEAAKRRSGLWSH